MRLLLLLTLVIIGVGVGCSDPATESMSFLPPTGQDMSVFRLPDGGQVINPNDPIRDGGSTADPSRPPVRVETRLQYEQTRAGDSNQVTCEAYDEAGELLADANPVVAVDPDIRIGRMNRVLSAEMAGAYSVWCVLPAFGIADETPESWTVRPGEPVTIDTVVAETEIDAGSSVRVSCAGQDAFGNDVEIAFADVDIEPARESTEMTEPMTFKFVSSGQYRLTCSVDGPGESTTAMLSVRAAPAEAMELSVVPSRAIYRVGDIVEAVVELSDTYGNRLDDAQARVTINPRAQELGDRRFLLNGPGQFTINALFNGLTVTGAPLERRVEITVDEGGPSISCVDPPYGAQIIAAPGSTLSLVAQVNDSAGVSSVQVNGQAVPFDEDGRLRVNVPNVWGANVHEIIAVDRLGERSSTLCGYFAARRYQDPDELLSDAVMVRLGESALDDGVGQRPFGSLGDVLRTVLNSPGFTTTIDGLARAANPIVPVECRARLLGRCLLNVGVDYRSLDIVGPNEVNLQFVDGGIRVDLVVRDLQVGARLNGTVETNGVITADRLRGTVVFDVDLGPDGDARVQLRELAGIDVGDISSDFEGAFAGTAVEVAIFLADTFFRDAIVEQVSEFLGSAMRTGLAGFFNEFQLGGLTARIEVPSLAGGQGTPLIFVSRLSRVDFQARTAIVGAAVRVDGNAVPGHESVGAALPQAALPNPPETQQASGVVDLGLINVILHRLWKAGYFEDEAADLASEFTGALPGVRIDLQLPAPPAVEGVAGNGRIRLHLGPLLGRVVLPALGNEPIGFRAATYVDVAVELLPDNRIQFSNAQVADLSVAVDGASFGAAERAGLDELLSEVIQGVIDQALTDSIPALPIPAFNTPETFAEFGVPAGIAVGLREGELSSDVRSWRAIGVLGEVEQIDAARDQPDEPRGNQCLNTCEWAMDGACDDGGPGSEFDVCPLGSDCADCGPR